MAFSNYQYQYPNPYAYPAQQPIQQPVQQPIQQPIQQPTVQNQQIQNGGFVSVRNETEARNYPVAPGNSITFKDEATPYVYTKTMGFSQLDRPVFEKYKLVRETVDEVSDLPEKEPEAPKVDNSAIDKLKREIKDVWGEIDVLKEQMKEQRVSSAPKRSSQKKEREDDEE